jgi:hypothetical protein
MPLNLVERWIYSPLESVPSPIVEDWQSCAAAMGCTPDQVDQVCDKAHEIYPAYDLPVCRQYAQRWDAPFHVEGFALVYCEMDITHLQAAQKDPRLIIFTNLDAAVDQTVIDSHAHLVAPARPAVTAATVKTDSAPPVLRDLLTALSERHCKFLASE